MEYTINNEYYRTQYPGVGGLVHWYKDGFMGIQGLQWTPRTIYLDTEEPFWPMALAHEWGHCLLALVKPSLVQAALEATKLDPPVPPRQQANIQRAEIMAWRLAKTYLRPALWNEYEALKALSSYWTIFGHEFPKRLRIVPCQKGEFWPHF